MSYIGRITLSVVFSAFVVAVPFSKPALGQENCEIQCPNGSRPVVNCRNPPSDVCGSSERTREPEPSTVNGNTETGRANPDNAAAAEAERSAKDAEFKRKQEALKGGLKTGNPGSSANSGNSAILGLKPSSGVTRDQTVKRIKELNCSAFWAVEALKAVRSFGLMSGEVKLEDEYTQMRQYAEFSAQAKDGKSVEGCPEIPINVPDVPPPLDSNPQIQFYEQLIVEAQNLAPQMIDTNRKMLETGTRLKETESAKKSEARKLGRIKLKPNTPANRDDKKKTISKIDDLGDQLAELQREVDALKKKEEAEEANAKDILTKFDNRP
jgi:hypothetical protein